MDLKELENGINPDIHWYYQSKKLPLFNYTRKTLKKADPLTIVDVGSGSGFFALEIEKNFPANIAKVYMVDIGYSEQEMAETRGKKVEKTHFIPEKIENSLVILMDVLEHLEDDLAMLKSIKKAATGGNNYFFITVPAFKSLWSGHDDYLGHYRRYKIATLRAVLDKAGFNTTNTYYLYGSLFPMVWAARKLDNLKKKEATSNMRPFNKLTNSVLLGLTSAEMTITSANKVFGVTCVAEGII
ncbi:MAG: methyltransferase domain-containing protein [Bacteroidetes bacterium]|nr:methyltransferase domain-containing protein [Bacteroidota bacterium]